MNNSETPLISIIVPVYNVEQWLPLCLDSLLVQSYKNIEILCINDGSKDNSWNILQDYAKRDNRIKIFSQSNSGPARARNVGLENATGQYLMFCDSDDLYEHNMCEEMLNCMRANDVDIVMCDSKLSIETENHCRSEASLNYHCLKYFGKLPLTEPIKSSTNVLLWNKIFKMDVIKKYGIHFPDGHEYDDNAFIYQYIAVSKSFYGLNKKLYTYRILETSIMANIYTHKKTQKLFDQIGVFEFTIDFLKRHNLFDSNKWLIKVFDNNIHYIVSLLSKSDTARYINLLRSKVLSSYHPSELKDFPMLRKCIEEKEFVKSISTHNSVTETTNKYWGGLIKKITTPNKREYAICGVPVLKRKTTPNYRKYYFLGIQYYRKRLSNQKGISLDDAVSNITKVIIKDAQSKLSYSLKDAQSKVSYLKRFTEGKFNDMEKVQMIFSMALYYKDLPAKDRYIVCFDCLYDKDAEAIDCYTFFRYLQSENIKSKYIILKSNKLSEKISEDRDVIVVENQDEFLTDYSALIAQSSFLITSYGGWGNFNNIIMKLPFVKYLYIDHGVIMLKKWVCNLYNPKHFDYILVPTKKTYDLYKQESKWQESQMLFSGLPRWDKLKKNSSSQKNIFVFFTWRKTFEKSREFFSRYNERIESLLHNPSLKELMEKNNIRINISFHHALLLNKIKLPRVPDYINIVDNNSISSYISNTDLLITDYSSICFDFMYLNTPVLFYLFDCNDMYLYSNDQQAMADTLSNQENLYNYCFDEKEVVDKIEHYIKRDFVLEEENMQKNEALFWSTKNNCETLYRELQKIS